MHLYRVHAYDDEHYATLVIDAETPERACSVAQYFVTAKYVGLYRRLHTLQTATATH